MSDLSNSCFIDPTSSHIYKKKFTFKIYCKIDVSRLSKYINYTLYLKNKLFLIYRTGEMSKFLSYVDKTKTTKSVCDETSQVTDQLIVGLILNDVERKKY
jgi:hypothetical protein